MYENSAGLRGGRQHRPTIDREVIGGSRKQSLNDAMENDIGVEGDIPRLSVERPRRCATAVDPRE